VHKLLESDSRGGLQNHDSPRRIFRPVLSNSSTPVGEVALTGSLRYQYQANVHPPAHSDSGRRAERAREFGGQLNRSSYSLSAMSRGGVQSLANGKPGRPMGLGQTCLGGRIIATATMQHLDTSPVSKLHVSWEAISLAAAKSSITNGESQPDSG